MKYAQESRFTLINYRGRATIWYKLSEFGYRGPISPSPTCPTKAGNALAGIHGRRELLTIRLYICLFAPITSKKLIRFKATHHLPSPSHVHFFHISKNEHTLLTDMFFYSLYPQNGESNKSSKEFCSIYIQYL